MVPKILMGFGVFMALMGLFMIAEGGIGSLVFGGIMVVGGYLWMQNIDSKKPEMESVVRIMMSGGNRDFKFNKTGTNSNSIAEFVANVESTLTAYHKKND